MTIGRTGPPSGDAGGPDALEQVVALVRASPIYRDVREVTIRTIGSDELRRVGAVDLAARRTKARLHQISGAFFSTRPRYRRWGEEIRAASGRGPEAQALAIRRLLSRHVSTRERLADAERFFATVFAAIGPYRSLVDVGCGLDPLFLPWIPGGPPSEYLACDVRADLIGFLNEVLPYLGAEGTAIPLDVALEPLPRSFDVALVLKLLPTLETVRHVDPVAWLADLRAARVVVSFPLRSLGGAHRGFATGYRDRFEARLAGSPWQVERLLEAPELVYLVTKDPR